MAPKRQINYRCVAFWTTERRSENEKSCVDVGVGGGVVLILANAEINKLTLIFDFNILTALKGWVGHAPQGRGALHIIIYRLCTLCPYGSRAKRKPTK